MNEVAVSSAETQPDSISPIDTRRLQVWVWVALIAIALVRAWYTRYEFDGDSISYLDIARAIVDGHPGLAVHAYWAPGYPVLLSFFLWLFHPNAYWECPLAHLVNVLIFAGGLASFQLFWSEVRRWHESLAQQDAAAMPASAFWALGYSVFGIATLSVIPVSRVGPDLLWAVFCCLAGWSVLRLRRSPRLGTALLLGLFLALGYYAKAPFFPIGFIFIACAGFSVPLSRRRLLLSGTALVLFLLLCAPFIRAISLSKHHFTFGESARLSQAFYINGVSYYVHWQGGPSGSGMPVHPTRKLNDLPEIYEFAAKDMGTYPPWFDPTYWYEGLAPHLNWSLQAKVFVANLILEFQTIMETGAGIVCATIVLVLMAMDRGQWIKNIRKLWPLWLPAAMALPMFALVHVEPRFMGGWLILLFAGAICACSLPKNSGTPRLVSCVGLAALIVTGGTLILQASQEALRSDHAAGRSPRSAVIATFLLQNGLRPGGRVAVIGDSMEAYWAHLARLQVVAEIPANIRRYQVHPALDYWESGPEQQKKALGILEQTGAEAVIADPQSDVIQGFEPSIVPAPWRKIDGTDAYVYFFHASQ
ncbi:hypothetical protein [Granulicella mallensis]|uniref:Glycosyltransferase RgtA/B/C/D-like domain-containing protein n=1 Tax=Granulicella mallensis (strain ATCC BAA-1857 / DSM 23137 / MP5ACTX8) TaxID=682795 RepID=G8P0X1_GRAMM|nr:hypothetical protein [Granulicella mallensis]AEU35818.1 hypothetical protein AciX8_1476 [Granulicella mallensis MP5ACTX8]